MQSQKRITVTIHDGDDISPSTLSAHDLAAIISSVETAVVATITPDYEPEDQGEDVKLGLVGIHDGSVELTFAAPLLWQKIIEDSFKRVVQFVHDPAGHHLPERAVSALEDLQRRTKRLGSEATFRWKGKQEDTAATLTATTDLTASVPHTRRLSGDTTLYAKVERVGGKKPKVALQPLKGETLYCSVNEDVAKELAKRLYTEVAVRGVATWDDDGNVVDFKVTGLLKWKPTSNYKAIIGLRNRFGDEYNNIEDPTAYIADLRGGAD